MNDLVSVIVLAYNSGTTILDTLESIGRQPYPDIELVISDDASTDDTVAIVRNWMVKNGERFKRCELFVNEENLGISKHSIKAMSYARGEWIKEIAGDDILLDNCISDDMDYVLQHPETEYLMTDMYLLDEHGLHEHSSGVRTYCRHVCKARSEKQYRLLLHEDTNFSPSVFIKADIIAKYGEPENPVRNIEDWPMRLHLTKSGCHLQFMDKPTVGYRQSTSSISRTAGYFFNPKHIEMQTVLENRLICPNIKKTDFLFHWNKAIMRFRYNLIIKMGNRRNGATVFVNYFLLLLQPSSYSKLGWEVIGKLYDKIHLRR